MCALSRADAGGLCQDQRPAPAKGRMKRPSSTATYVSISHYADLYGVTRQTVYKWLNEPGLLDWYRVARVVRIKNRPPVSRRSSSPTS